MDNSAELWWMQVSDDPLWRSAGSRSGLVLSPSCLRVGWTWCTSRCLPHTIFMCGNAADTFNIEPAQHHPHCGIMPHGGKKPLWPRKARRASRKSARSRHSWGPDVPRPVPV